MAATARRLTRAWESFFRLRETWSIGLIHEPITTLLRSDARPHVTWFPRASGKSLADPFAIAKDGRVYVLCEEFGYGEYKGRIVYFELLDTDHLSKPKVALELPCHLSYPYLLEYRGDIYCVPETHQAREVCLYKALAFPNNWTKVETLLDDFAGVDPTIFHHEGHWWLTCGDEELSHGWDRLFIWHAEEPKGPWIPHERNPVKTDIGSSRPAGTPFMYNNNLFRPAQDCSRTYGGRVVLNRIVTLTPTKFHEEVASIVDPHLGSPYPDGLHTVSSAGNITLIDGKRFERIASTMLKWRIEQFLHPK